MELASSIIQVRQTGDINLLTTKIHHLSGANFYFGTNKIKKHDSFR